MKTTFKLCQRLLVRCVQEGAPEGHLKAAGWGEGTSCCLLVVFSSVAPQPPFFTPVSYLCVPEAAAQSCWQFFLHLKNQLHNTKIPQLSSTPSSEAFHSKGTFSWLPSWNNCNLLPCFPQRKAWSCLFQLLPPKYLRVLSFFFFFAFQVFKM